MLNSHDCCRPDLLQASGLHRHRRDHRQGGSLARAWQFGGFLLSLCLVTGSMQAAAAPQPALTTPLNPAAHGLDRQDLESWLDGLIPYSIEREDIAGAVVVVVSNGKVLLQKGYGHADVKTQRPMDPESTLVRPGSVSKLFTWTAVMQQVEKGRINLDADVNTYLDFKVAPFEGQPITMRHLMTHTAGFEEFLKDILVADGEPALPLSTYIKRQVPVRVALPGALPAYSNYGSALAGYIVQRVSGQAFEAYQEQHIFGPLGMKHSSFMQPLPAGLQQAMSSGYGLGSAPSKPYEIFAPTPAGASAVTASDMAKFMLAHLSEGAYEGRRILQASTTRMMHDTTTTTVSPSINRMLLGFFEFNRNGRRIIGHDGDTRLFHSLLVLLPDDGAGLFVSFNSNGKDGAARSVRQAVGEGFADRYFPVARPAVTVAPEVAKAHSAILAGAYDASLREQSGPLSIVNLLTQSEVTTDESGHLIASPVNDPGGQPKRFEEVEPFVWQEVGGGGSRLAAKVRDGRVLAWGHDQDPTVAYTPTPWWRNASWLAPGLVGALFVLVVSSALWPIGWAFRRHHGVVIPINATRASVRRWSRLAAVSAAAVMIAWLSTAGFMLSNFYISSAIDPWLLLLHALSVMVFPSAAVIAVWNAWVSWKAPPPKPGLVGRAGSVLALVSCLVLLWVAIVFHLIGFSVAF